MPGVAAAQAESQLWLFEPALKIDMARLRQHREHLAHGKHAPNTVTGYECDWKRFKAWCIETNREALPATSETIELYVTYELEAIGLKVSSVQRHISAIRDAHRRAKIPMPPTEGARELLTNARHLRKESPQGKRPITAQELRKISRKLKAKGGNRAMRDRALLVVGFASGLRRSNLRGLNLADVQIVRKGVIVAVRHSKTDQTGKGTILGLYRGEHPDTCPALCLKEWMKLRGDTAGPLFTRIGSAGEIDLSRLSGKSIGTIVKRCVRLIGLDGTKYGGHSLRAGCATAAFSVGAPAQAIMRRTGHRKLETLNGYIRTSDPFAGVNPLAGAL